MFFVLACPCLVLVWGGGVASRAPCRRPPPPCVSSRLPLVGRRARLQRRHGAFHPAAHKSTLRHTNQPDCTQINPTAHEATHLSTLQINPTAHKSTRRHTNQPDSTRSYPPINPANQPDCTQINPTAHQSTRHYPPCMSTRRHTSAALQPPSALFLPCGAQSNPLLPRTKPHTFAPLAAARGECSSSFVRPVRRGCWWLRGLRGDCIGRRRCVSPRSRSAFLLRGAAPPLCRRGCWWLRFLSLRVNPAAHQSTRPRTNQRFNTQPTHTSEASRHVWHRLCVSAYQPYLTRKPPDCPQINPTTHTMCPSRSGAANFAAARTEPTHRINPATHTDTRSP